MLPTGAVALPVLGTLMQGIGFPASWNLLAATLGYAVMPYAAWKMVQR